MVITSTFYQYNKSKKKTSLIILGISLSTFLGGCLMALFNIKEMIHVIEAVSLTVTTGMLLYISLMELVPKVRHCEHKKITILGIVLGFLLLLIPHFL